MGVLGGVVPGLAEDDDENQVDTTVFKSVKIATDGLGSTEKGRNSLQGFSSVFQQSGSTLPQVSNGGSVSGIYHIVTAVRHRAASHCSSFSVCNC